MAELRHFELQNVDNKSHYKHNSQENMGFDNHSETEQDLPPEYHHTLNVDGTASLNDENASTCSRLTFKVQSNVSNFLGRNGSFLNKLMICLVVLCYFAYFGYAMHYSFGNEEAPWRLLVITSLVVFGYIIKLIRYCVGKCTAGSDGHDDDAKGCLARTSLFLERMSVAQLLPALLLLGFLVFVIVGVGIDQPRNLVSFGGIFFLLAFCFLTSFNASKVIWRPVIWGITIEMMLALVILRTSWGIEAFIWLGDRFTEFLSHVDQGIIFVFGVNYADHFFAFKVLSVIIFFSSFVSVLYYLGAMQVLIGSLGRLLSTCLGTTATESINAAGNIFLGQTECPFIIRPFIKDMTKSEMHAVMAGGFASVAGSTMAGYILYGVPANHLLTASVMAAPTSLALSKLAYPETEKSKGRSEDVYNIAKGDHQNIFAAAADGASMAIPVVSGVAANIISFVSMLAFINATLIWLGDLAGFEDFSFQFICSYLFWPLAYLMGVEYDDCGTVGELIGTKLALNEFIAYSDLGEFITNRNNLDSYLSDAAANITGNMTGMWNWQGDDIVLQDTGVVLPGGVMDPRSVVIATYALCSFANFGSIGIQLGVLGSMAPERKSEMAQIIFRAMIVGNIVGFMNASVAGLLYNGE